MRDRTGIQLVDRLLDNGETSTNKHGNVIRKSFLDADRYLFDFNLGRCQWMEFDTQSDAWYFG